MITKQKAEMYAAIKRHGENLLALFPKAKIKSPVELCKALHRLEAKAHKAAENWCNGYEYTADGADLDGDDEYWYDEGIRLAEKAAAILGEPVDLVRVAFNGDARGYALKIKNLPGVPDHNAAIPSNIYKDWGGYGIIAPDFTPNK